MKEGAWTRAPGGGVAGGAPGGLPPASRPAHLPAPLATCAGGEEGPAPRAAEFHLQTGLVPTSAKGRRTERKAAERETFRSGPRCNYVSLGTEQMSFSKSICLRYQTALMR